MLFELVVGKEGGRIGLMMDGLFGMQLMQQLKLVLFIRKTHRLYLGNNIKG